MVSDVAISVVVGTFGDRDYWTEMAERALISAHRQTSPAVDVQHVHSDTLAQARNLGIERARGSHVVICDADDELDEGYLAAMYDACRSKMADEYSSMPHKPWLFQPSTLGVVDGEEDSEPVMIPQKPLDTGNFMVIGTMFERSLALNVGGFEEWPVAEDWDFFTKMHLAGAGFAQVPAAVYRVHVNPNGRNSQPRKVQVDTFNAIRKKNFG